LPFPSAGSGRLTFFTPEGEKSGLAATTGGKEEKKETPLSRSKAEGKKVL